MDPLSTGLLIVLMVASFYLLIIRPNRRRAAEQTKLQQMLQPGARVMLSSGIYGTVVSVGDKQATVEIAPGLEIKVLKQAVMQAVTEGSQFAEDADDGDGPADELDYEPLDSREDNRYPQDPRKDDLYPNDPRTDDLQDPHEDDAGPQDPRDDDESGRPGEAGKN